MDTQHPTVGFECDELEPLENGVVSKPSNSVGSVARYSCEPGFMISGPRERVCQLSAASWSESTPSCEGIMPQQFIHIVYNTECVLILFLAHA